MSFEFEDRDGFTGKNKKYILKEMDKKLSLTGGTMSGDINMGNQNY